MSRNRVYFALQNPLECLHHARKLVFENVDNTCVVVLPRHIETPVFENFLLESSPSSSGVEIQRISSLARNFLSRASQTGHLKRVDQVMLSERFSAQYTRGVARTLLNSVAELRQSYFDFEYIKDVFSDQTKPEHRMLLDVFKNYEKFLSENGFCDDAVFNKKFIDALHDPLNAKIINPNTVFIFAGFTDFSSSDLMILEAVCKKAKAVYMSGPDVFIDELDYSKLLMQTFTSLDFKIQKVASQRLGRTLYEMKSISEEVLWVTKNLSVDLQASVYVPKDLDLYYSLFKYYMKSDSVSVKSSVRLDRSKMLSMLKCVFAMRSGEYRYNDLLGLLSSPFLWQNYDDIRSLMAHIKRQELFPTQKEYWAKLCKVEQIKIGAASVFNFLNLIDEVIPLKATPSEFVAAVQSFIKQINLTKRLGTPDLFELSTVENLLFRVAQSLDSSKQFSAQEFCNKLSFHAEENYLVRGLPNFKPITVAATRLITSNTTKDVWFLGMNEESYTSIPEEDALMNDNIILSLRKENFIKPTSKESKILNEKIVSDASAGVKATYIAKKGKPAKFFADIEPVKPTMSPNVLTGVYAQLSNTKTTIKDYKLEKVSPTSLERYIECPYKYFASNVLKIENSYSDEFGLSPLKYGSIAHEALEKLLPLSLKGNKIDFEREVGLIIKEHEDALKINPSPVNKIFAARIAGVIENLIEGEKEFFKTYPFVELLKTEQVLKCYVDIEDGKLKLSSKGDVAFSGKTDRMDLNTRENSFYIVDYKKSLMPKRSEIEDGRAMQLILYTMASLQLFPEYKFGGAYYISLSNVSTDKVTRSWRLGVASSIDGLCSSQGKRSCITFDEGTLIEDMSSLLSKRVISAICDLKTGEFTPNPINDLSSKEDDALDNAIERSVCVKCDYKRGCGVKYWY